LRLLFRWIKGKVAQDIAQTGRFKKLSIISALDDFPLKAWQGRQDCSCQTFYSAALAV
jgi:hypothetical protein